MSYRLYDTVPKALKISTLWQPRYNSSHTSCSSFWDGHGRCTRVCECACRVSYRNEHKISREVQGCCARGRATQTHTYLLGISKATAQPWVQQQRRHKQQCSSSRVSNSGLCGSHRASLSISGPTKSKEIFCTTCNSSNEEINFTHPLSNVPYHIDNDYRIVDGVYNNIAPPRSGFPSSIARQLRECQYRTIRLRKNLGDYVFQRRLFWHRP